LEKYSEQAREREREREREEEVSLIVDAQAKFILMCFVNRRASP